MASRQIQGRQVRFVRDFDFTPDHRTIAFPAGMTLDAGDPAAVKALAEGAAELVAAEAAESAGEEA